MLVMKFGGASVATPESFRKIAELIVRARKRDTQIVVVVSAMGKTTDQLLELARNIHPNPPVREQDMLISVGERISAALLTMALDLAGVKAVSFTGSQSGIITSNAHTDAEIVDVQPKRILEALAQGQVAVVAGFQGVSQEGKEITTLGRGGSDTTAVALAAALGGMRVEFYKDVPGIFTADPKKDPSAQVFSSLSYQDALEITRAGAKVLHSRCIEMAQKKRVELAVLSFENPEEPGTVIGGNRCSHN